jgi:hypothetical protein
VFQEKPFRYKKPPKVPIQGTVPISPEENKQLQEKAKDVLVCVNKNATRLRKLPRDLNPSSAVLFALLFSFVLIFFYK